MVGLYYPTIFGSYPLGYEADIGSAYLYARNLFDEDYVTQIMNDRILAHTSEPRVTGLQFSAHF